MCNIAIPDSFALVDLDLVDNRVLLLTVVRDCGFQGGKNQYLSELWMFTPPDSGQANLTIADRQTLVSYPPMGGKSQRVCRRTMACRNGIALEVTGYEHTATVLFDLRGNAVAVDWSDVGRLCQCFPDYIRPLAWVWMGIQQNQLVCLAGERGGDPNLLVYDPDSGSLTVKPALEEMSELVYKVIVAGNDCK